eukprot:g23598.t1
MALGLFSGLRALLWALVLLISVIFTISVVMQSLFKDDLEEFHSVDRAMFTLFRCFTDACETYGGDPIPEKLFVKYGPPFNIIHPGDDACDGGSLQPHHGCRGPPVLATPFRHVRRPRMVLAKFINEPRAGERSQDVLKRVSEDALRKLASLTDAGRSRNIAEQRRVANEAFNLLEECHINITREVFQAWLKDPEFVKVLEDADVDISNKFELFNILDVEP